jgi:hypothetical protein
MISRLISPYESPSDCPVDPSVLAPRLLPGETTQGFLTASFIPRQTLSKAFDELSFNRVSLKKLLCVKIKCFRDNTLTPSIV